MSGKSESIIVSVVIPTYNRREEMRALLESLAQQTLPADQWEVIVVDDASADGTAAMVNEFKSKLPAHLVCHVNPENRGAAYSRNAGARLARGRLLAYTDSDCLVTPRWLELGISGFTDSTIGLVTGPTRNKVGEKAKFFTLGAATASAGEDPIFPTTNILYRTDVFWEVEGFAEHLYFGNAAGMPVEGGDADTGWKIKEAGYATAYIKEMLVYHEIRNVTPWAWLLSHFRYSVIPFLIRLHPGLRTHIVWWGPFCFPQNLLFYVAVLGVFLAVSVSPWALLLALPLLGRLWRLLEPGMSPLKWPKTAVQVTFLSMGQVLICGSLIYGSIRARRLVI